MESVPSAAVGGKSVGGDAAGRLVVLETGDHLAQPDGLESFGQDAACPAELGETPIQRDLLDAINGPVRVAQLVLAADVGRFWGRRGIEVGAGHRTAAAPAVIREIEGAENLRVLARLIGCQASEQAGVAVRAREPVDHQRAPVGDR